MNEQEIKLKLKELHEAMKNGDLSVNDYSTMYHNLHQKIAKLKANEIVFNMQKQPNEITLEQAKYCASILCEEVLDNLEDHTGDEIKKWSKIKEEIKNL